jgi:hypothetical protein
MAQYTVTRFEACHIWSHCDHFAGGLGVGYFMGHQALV